MDYSYQVYSGNGSTRSWAFSFQGPNQGYISKGDLLLTVDGVETQFTLTSSNTFEVEEAPIDGASVVIRRSMDPSNTYADFQGGASFDKFSINRSFLYLLYLIQQIMDGYFGKSLKLKGELDMGGHRVINVPLDQDSSSAVPRNYVDSAVRILRESISGLGDLSSGVVESLKEVMIPATYGSRQLKDWMVGVDYTYNNVQEMMDDANLFPGSKVKTLGYFHPGDLGGNSYTIMEGPITTPDGGSVIPLKLSGLYARGNFPEGVFVSQFGGVAGVDIRDPLASALAFSDKVTVPSFDCNFSGCLKIGSNKRIHFLGTRIAMDVSGIDGRGFHFADGARGSKITGSAEITAICNSLGEDGFKNAVFSAGPDYYVPGSPAGVFDCEIVGDFKVNHTGPQNAKTVGIVSLVDGFKVCGVVGKGKSNYGFAAHWGGRGSHSELTDATWHPTNLLFEDCYGDGEGWLRSFTASACGVVNWVRCGSNSTTLAYNLFVGDYGYTYNQNLTPSDIFKYKVTSCTASGPGAAVSVGCVSAGLNSSPEWRGDVNGVSVTFDGLSINCEQHVTGLVFAATGLASIHGVGIHVDGGAANHPREWLYPQNCGDVVLSAKVRHSNRARIRGCDRVKLDIDYRKAVPTPDSTSYAVALEGVGFAEISGVIRDSRVGVATLPGSGDTRELHVHCRFENIGLHNVDSAASYTSLDGCTQTGCGKTTTTTNIYSYKIASPVGYSCIGTKTLAPNDARYILYLDPVAKNGVVSGNYFGDILSGSANPAAIYNGGGGNLKLGDDNVLSGDVNLLVYPNA